MGLIFNRRKKIGRRTTANFSRSGVSLSRRMGPITVNSRGRATIRLAKGLRIRL